MLKKVSFILLLFYFSNGDLLSQTNELPKKIEYSLGFSTYLSHTDKYAANFDIYTDKEGSTYISGNTRDKNFPATEGAYQTELKGNADAFVAKFSSEGEIVFATLIGGSKREHHTGITVDNEGFIYLIGGTHSSDFPVTSGAYDTSFNGEGEWAGDVFLTKINPSGSEIIFSTFIGGELEETAGSGEVKIDSKGNIIIAGTTLSSDFPTTKGVISKELTKQDCFISKFNPTGEKLIFSTFLGNGVMDMITSVAVDDEDNIYATGFTVSANLPVTNAAIRKEIIMPKVGGFEDGIDHFIAKINETGTEILYLSYIGAGGHMGSNVSWSRPNRLVVSGSTKNEGFATITENIIGKRIIGDRDGFFAVFNSENMTLLYSSLIGGSEAEHIQGAYFLNEHNIVLGGKTNSVDFPLTENALYSEYPVWEKTFNSTFWGRRKSFVAVVDIKNNKLLYSTYLGDCFQFRIHLDQHGNISFAGEAGQREAAGMTGFPITENRFMEPPTYLMLGKLILENSELMNKH